MTMEIPTPVCGLVRNDIKIGMQSAVRWRFPHQERELVRNDMLIDLQSAVRAPPSQVRGGKDAFRTDVRTMERYRSGGAARSESNP